MRACDTRAGRYARPGSFARVIHVPDGFNFLKRVETTRNWLRGSTRQKLKQLRQKRKST